MGPERSASPGKSRVNVIPDIQRVMEGRIATKFADIHIS